MINGYFVGNKVVSSSSGAFSLYEKSRFGEKKGSRIEYSTAEVLYLVEGKKMKVLSRKKEFGFDALVKKFRMSDKKIETRHAVFSDLRKKGYLVKSALKFGAEFRVYEKGKKVGEDHARWLLNSVKEADKINWHEFTAKSRVAHSTKKNLLLGIVDEEGDVTYYEVGWVKV
jgi:tRNA-intron endonuclease, archaea type